MSFQFRDKFREDLISLSDKENTFDSIDNLMTVWSEKGFDGKFNSMMAHIISNEPEGKNRLYKSEVIKEIDNKFFNLADSNESSLLHVERLTRYFEVCATDGGYNNIYNALALGIFGKEFMANLIRFLIIGIILKEKDVLPPILTLFNKTSKLTKTSDMYEWGLIDYCLSLALVKRIKRPKHLEKLELNEWYKFSAGQDFHVYLCSYLIEQPIYLVDYFVNDHLCSYPISLKISYSYFMGKYSDYRCSVYLYYCKNDNNCYCLKPKRSTKFPIFQFSYLPIFMNEQEWALFFFRPLGDNSEYLRIQNYFYGCSNDIDFIEEYIRTKGHPAEFKSFEDQVSWEVAFRRYEDTYFFSVSKIAAGEVLVNLLNPSISYVHSVTRSPDIIWKFLSKQMSVIEKFRCNRVETTLCSNSSASDDLSVNSYVVIAILDIILVRRRRGSKPLLAYLVEWETPPRTIQLINDQFDIWVHDLCKSGDIWERFVTWRFYRELALREGKTIPNIPCPRTDDISIGSRIKPTGLHNISSLSSEPLVQINAQYDSYLYDLQIIFKEYESEGLFGLSNGFKTDQKQAIEVEKIELKFYNEVYKKWSSRPNFHNYIVFSDHMYGQIYNCPYKDSSFKSEALKEFPELENCFYIRDPSSVRQHIIRLMKMYENKPVVFLFIVPVDTSRKTAKHCFVGIRCTINGKNQLMYFDPANSDLSTQSHNNFMVKLKKSFKYGCTLKRYFGTQDATTTDCYLRCFNFVAQMLDGQKFENFMWLTNIELNRYDRGQKLAKD